MGTERKTTAMAPLRPRRLGVAGGLVCALLAASLVGCGGGDEGPGESLPAESLARRSTLEVKIDSCRFLSEDPLMAGERYERVLTATGSVENLDDEPTEVDLDVEVVTAIDTSFVMEGSVTLMLEAGEKQDWRIEATEEEISRGTLFEGDDEGYTCAVFD